MKFGIIAALCVSACCIGCTTYRVRPDPGMTQEHAIQNIDTLVKHEYASALYVDKKGRSIGADSTGFVNAWYVRRSYSEIEDVHVQGSLFGIGFFGLLDPTITSGVFLRYNDGTGECLHPTLFASKWLLLPFYFFNPSWRECHDAALGFEFMRLVHRGAPSRSVVNK